jgi:hypothetical protein
MPAKRREIPGICGIWREGNFKRLAHCAIKRLSKSGKNEGFKPVLYQIIITVIALSRPQ